MKHFILGILIGAALVILLYADACQRRDRAAARRELRRQTAAGELDDDQLIDARNPLIWKLSSDDDGSAS